MHRNILVPFNGSPSAVLGLRAAVRLAKAHGSRIRLIYVLTHVPFLGLGSHARRTEEALGDLAQAHRAALRWATLEVQEEGIEAESRLIEAVGEGLGETIVAEAHAWPAQLIVCGTRGGHGVARLLHESHAELIVRKSSIPVLLIPADGRSKPELARHLRPSRPDEAPSLLEPAVLTARAARAALTAAAAAAAAVAAGAASAAGAVGSPATPADPVPGVDTAVAGAGVAGDSALPAAAAAAAAARDSSSPSSMSSGQRG